MIPVRLWDYEAVINAELIDYICVEDGCTTIKMVSGAQHHTDKDFDKVLYLIRNACVLYGKSHHKGR